MKDEKVSDFAVDSYSNSCSLHNRPSKWELACILQRACSGYDFLIQMSSMRKYFQRNPDIEIQSSMSTKHPTRPNGSPTMGGVASRREP